MLLDCGPVTDLMDRLEEGEALRLSEKDSDASRVSDDDGVCLVAVSLNDVVPLCESVTVADLT